MATDERRGKRKAGRPAGSRNKMKTSPGGNSGGIKRLKAELPGTGEKMDPGISEAEYRRRWIGMDPSSRLLVLSDSMVDRPRSLEVMDQFEDRTARLLILLAIESALNDPKGVSAKELAQSILNPGGRAWKAGGESRRVRSKGGGKEFDEDKLRLARAKLQALSEEERDAMIKTHVMAVKDGGYLVKPAEREGSDED